MPRTKTTKFKLKVRERRKLIRKSRDDAKAALKAGKKAVARARKSGDPELIRVNEEALEINKTVLENLQASLDAMDEIQCVDQFLNSDPVYRVES